MAPARGRALRPRAVKDSVSVDLGFCLPLMREDDRDRYFCETHVCVWPHDGNRKPIARTGMKK